MLALVLDAFLCAPCYPQFEQELLPSDPRPKVFFGHRLCIHEDQLIVGCPGNSSYPMDHVGAAYVFNRQGVRWSEQRKLTEPDAAVGTLFGSAVAIREDVVLIGAPKEDTVYPDSGASYIYRRTGTNWLEEAKLMPPFPTWYGNFGALVSLEEGVAVVVGSWWSPVVHVYEHKTTNWVLSSSMVVTNSEGLGCTASDITMSSDTILVGCYDDHGLVEYSGSVHVFSRNGTNWTRQTKLLARDGAAWDYFGASVDLSSNRAVVGAYVDDDDGAGSGSAYVFLRNGTNWSLEAKLHASDAAAWDSFGRSVAIYGDLIVVGADQNDDLGNVSGSAYVFARDGTNWNQIAKLLPSDGVAYALFGNRVALCRNFAVIGAPEHPTVGADAGAAYSFDLSFTPPRIAAITRITNSVSLSLADLCPPYCYSVDRGFNLLSNGWTEVDVLCPTGSATNWQGVLSNEWPQVFYRLRCTN